MNPATKKKWTIRDEWLFNARERAEAKCHAIAKKYDYNMGAGLAIHTARVAIRDAINGHADAAAIMRVMLEYDAKCDPGHMQEATSGLWRHFSGSGFAANAIASGVTEYANRICEGLKKTERTALSRLADRG